MTRRADIAPTQPGRKQPVRIISMSPDFAAAQEESRAVSLCKIASRVAAFQSGIFKSRWMRRIRAKTLPALLHPQGTIGLFRFTDSWLPTRSPVARLLS